MASQGARPVSYDYPRPALTVDVVIATREARPRVLLIRRKIWNNCIPPEIRAEIRAAGRYPWHIWRV
jgi:hypothetical protein